MSHKIPDNIFFIGFMGTGKSCVSQLVSKDLSYGLIDMDSKIEKRAGKPITAIFAEDGEPAFRDMETNFLRELQRDEIARFVIACGGGIVTRPQNVELMKSVGFVILLTASVDEILRRTARDRSRPLLQADDKRKRVEDLLAQRDALYKSAANLIIDTTGQTPEEIAEQIVNQLRAEGGSPSGG